MKDEPGEGSDCDNFVDHRFQLKQGGYSPQHGNIPTPARQDRHGGAPAAAGRHQHPDVPAEAGEAAADQPAADGGQRGVLRGLGAHTHLPRHGHPQPLPGTLSQSHVRAICFT